MADGQQDWFAENAPTATATSTAVPTRRAATKTKPAAAAPTDWFADNAPASAATPATPAAVPSLASRAAAIPAPAADLTSQLPGRSEGTYRFVDTSKAPPNMTEAQAAEWMKHAPVVYVPYSKALALLNHPEAEAGMGSDFARFRQHLDQLTDSGQQYALHPDEADRLFRDYEADPALRQARRENFVSTIPAAQVGIGVAREGARTAVGAHDIVAGHPAVTAPPSAVRQFATAPQANAFQSLGGVSEQAGEILLPEATLGRILEGIGLVKGTAEGVQAADAAREAYATAIKTGKSATEALTAADAAAKSAKMLEQVPRAQRLAMSTGRGIWEGAKAAGEQGGQQYVKSGGDTGEAERAALYGGIAGGGSVLAADVVGETGQFTKWVLRHRLDANEFETEKLIGKVRAANADIETAVKEADAANAKKVAEAQKAVDAAKDAAAKSAAEADLAIAKHEQAKVREQAVNAMRQNLTDAVQRTRADIYQRLQNQQNAARVYFRDAYADLEKEAAEKAKGTAATGEEGEEGEEGEPGEEFQAGEHEPPYRVTYADLADDVHAALQKVKGSAESTKAFRDILARAKGVEEAEEAEGLSLDDVANLAPDEKARLAEHVEEGGAENAAGIPLAHLNGYYSELGRVVNSPATPGDVKQAAQLLRDRLDGHVKELLGPELYKKNLALRAQYRSFAETFKDYAGLGRSPVAQSLRANDPYNATRPFVTPTGRAPEVARRVRTMIVGDAKDATTQYLGKDIHENYARVPVEGGQVGGPTKLAGSGTTTPSWRYRRNTASMIDHLRSIEAQQAILEKRGKTAADLANAAQKTADEAQAAREAATGRTREAREAAAVKPELKPIPTKQQLTPSELQAAKRTALHISAHNLGKFGLWVGVAGITGGMGIFLKTGNLQHALEFAAGGVGAGLLTPAILSAMLDKPAVVGALTQLTRKDLTQLAAMPADERAGVEGAIRQLADAAVTSRKLRAEQIPWLRVLGGQAGKNLGVQAVQGAGAAVRGAEQWLNAPPTPKLMPLPGEPGAPTGAGAPQ